MDHIHIFNTPEDQAIALADRFCNFVIQNLKSHDHLSIALSGGHTPIQFFEAIVNRSNDIAWEKLHFFWVDERCVPSDDKESNYGMAKEYLLDKVDIPSKNIYPIYGEVIPEKEVKRYSRIIFKNVNLVNGWPVFNWIFLGMGDDGHIASIFPGSPLVEKKNSIVDTTTHPITGQQRITLTLGVLNRAKFLTFLVRGKSKAHMIRKVLRFSHKHPEIPATKILPVDGIAEWYLDIDAAAGLD